MDGIEADRSALTTEVRSRVPASLPFAVAVGIAWVAIAAVTWSGHGAVLHHDAIVHNSHPFVAVAGFLVAWQAMVAAMMLPSAWPVFGYFRLAASPHRDRRSMTALFTVAYFGVWTGFGAGALLFDLGVHNVVDGSSWLTDHAWVVAAATLLVAGGFQFSPLRERCMHVCRHPLAYLLHAYQPDRAGAIRVGLHHALFCLGCCWPLMLLMFGVGLTNLVWMAALTAVMVYEKVGIRGQRLAQFVGVALLVWGALVALHPIWLPGALAV